MEPRFKFIKSTYINTTCENEPLIWQNEAFSTNLAHNEMNFICLFCQLRFVNRFKRIFLFESYSLHFSLFYTEASSEYGEQ
ncbi:MAG: hypothetical protein MJZ22_04495, partial [Candidatus Saccharibacteria bacterium]|nr:hypothetical protein [Candidatus Saccharibacteria bacterium]